jgi:two-component system, OmpR family, response regulator ChvI
MTTLLLVEDDAGTLEAWAELCSHEGYSIHCAYDGLAAWEILTTTPVDVVISDLRMPRMSGGVLCERMRESRTLSDTVFILVSGELTPPAFVRYDCYLRKPLDMPGLFATVLRLVTSADRNFGAVPTRTKSFFDN